MRIAIIGSSLGGAVLADLLAGHHDVTIFERGPDPPCRPEPASMTSHAFGLYPSFAYGLGGTTNFWQGGLVELSEEVSEARLVELLSDLAEAGLPDGVTGHLVMSSEDSLPATIAADRGAAVRVVTLPGFIWSILSLAHRHAMLQKALSATRVLSDRLLRATLGFAIVPIAPKYLHLFRGQSDMADTLGIAAAQMSKSGSAEGR